MREKAQRLRGTLESAAREGRLVITGHDTPDVDALASCHLLWELCAWWGIEARIVLPTRADRQPRRVLPRFGLDPDAWRGEILPGDRLALVDHHAPLHGGTVVACVDHHPTAQPLSYPFVLIEPSGACALTLLRLMRGAGMPDEDARTALVVTAVYLDTIALRSTKIPPQEAAWAREEAKRLGLDEAWLRGEGLRLQDMSLPPQTLAQLGKKTYAFGEKRVVSTYVQTDAMTQEKLNAILGAVRRAMREEGAALWVFLVHDPAAGRTTEFDVTPDGCARRRDYDRLISRGRDVMPRVERELTKIGEEEHGGHAGGAAIGAGRVGR